MNKIKTIMALALIALAMVPMGLTLLSDESEAYLTINDGIHGEGFATNSDGTLFLHISNDEEIPITITLTVIIDGNEDEAKTFPDIEVKAGGGDIELRFRVGGAGEHSVKVTGTPSSLFFPNNNNTGTINVKQSILDKPTTYIAIAVVVILIVIAFYLHMRNAPAKKPDTTFRELEEQKKASKGEVESAPKASATEKKRYDKASTTEPPNATPKEKAKPAPEEKKATTFTELEKEKASKKETAKKDSSSSDEPKKLKYVSSRRK